MPSPPMRQASTQLRAYSPEGLQVLTTEAMGLLGDVEEVQPQALAMPRRQSSTAQMMLSSSSASAPQVVGTATSARVTAVSVAAAAAVAAQASAAAQASQGPVPQVYRQTSQAQQPQQ